MSARQHSVLSEDVALKANLESGSDLTAFDEGESQEKPFLRRDEFICSTAHNAHLQEDFLEDTSSLFGRPLPVKSPSRSRSTTPASIVGLKHVSSEKLLRKFSRSADTQSLRSIPGDRVAPSVTFLGTVSEERRPSKIGVKSVITGSPNTIIQQAVETATGPLPQKPPRKIWRRSKKVNSKEKFQVRAESSNHGGPFIMAIHNDIFPCSVDDSIASSHSIAVKEERDTLTQVNSQNPQTNNQTENESTSKGVQGEEGPSSRRPSRLIRRNSSRRPLSCTATEETTSKLYKRASLTHSRLPNTSDCEIEYSSRANGVAPYRPRRIKRESLIHPPQPPKQDMPLGTSKLSQPTCVNARFGNPWPTWKKPSLWTAIKWKVTTKNNTALPSCEKELDKALPVVPLEQDIHMPPQEGIRITWMGHSTTLIQFDNISVLTDPMMSERASPISMLGPKRFRRFPGSIYDLPKLDAVVISHNHYDHLDYNSVILLNARFGADLHWFVPQGLGAWMRRSGCQSVTELSWWEEGSLPQSSATAFVFTPAQHWSKRTITDDNKSLWGSWSILGPQHRFYFAGDTGYCTGFKEIGEQYGPFDLAAIPIGAYEPRWMMKPQHVNPEEAVKIHQDVRAKRSLGIHWGTFPLTSEYYLEPPQKLAEEVQKAGLSKEEFFVLKHGESRLLFD